MSLSEVGEGRVCEIHCLAQKSFHLDLTKQIGTSLLFDKYYIGDYLSAGKKFNPS